MEQKWTVESVKDQLPDVKVIVHGKAFTAVVRGRKNRFATVSPYGYTKNGITFWGLSCDFAWETVTHSLNTGKPLIF